MEAVTASERLFVLDRYKAVLKERYPDVMLEAYTRTLMKDAAAASNLTDSNHLFFIFVVRTHIMMAPFI